MDTVVRVGDWVQPRFGFGARPRCAVWPQRAVHVDDDGYFYIEGTDHGRKPSNYDVVEAPAGVAAAVPYSPISDALSELQDPDELRDKLRASVLADWGTTPDFSVDTQGVTRILKDTNPKTRYGQAKPPLALVPGSALLFMAEALRDGSDKYGQANWRTDPVSASTYSNALLRHFFAWQEGEDVDPTSGVPHLAHAMTNIAIILDAMACGMLIDDRPTKVPLGNLIREFTRPITADEKNPNNG